VKQPIKNVVLVHGAFADGSGWKRVADILKNDGYKVSVAQPPETSYADDQKYTKAAIDAMGGPVVLVGHSYGGSIITEAGNHANVAALVYIAAFALDEGESCASIEQALPQASKAFKPDSNGLWWIDQAHFVADFAADIPRDEAEFMAIAQVPISFETPVGEDEDAHLSDFVEDKGVISPSDAAINLNMKEQMATMLKTLTPREERIIKMRFGIEDGNEHTLEEVGQVFALTRERIRQIEAKALRKLRHPSCSRKLRAFLELASRN
jgi:RNA polymerase sigma factor (sigma-70 family)